MTATRSKRALNVLAAKHRLGRARRRNDDVGALELLFDALETQFTEITLRRDPDCPVCGDHPTITDYIDYVEFCAGPRAQVTQ